MRRVLPTFACLVAGLMLAGCVYDLELAGKRCDSDRPCPQGYSCLLEGEQLVCLRSGGDGGPDDGDGGDGADQPACSQAETRCSADLTALLTCTAGTWEPTACQIDSYCLDTEEREPACVPECASTVDCPQLTWCNPDSRHCEPKGACQDPGVDRCNPTLDAVIRCDLESGRDLDVDICSAGLEYCDPFAPACKPYCDDDLVCAAWPLTSCDPSSRKCVPVELCAGDEDCAIGSQCVENAGACVPIPAQDGSLPGGGPPNLDCYIGNPLPPDTQPATCNLQGRVVYFLNQNQQASTIGLVVRIHRQEDVLTGVIDSPIVSRVAYDDGGYGQYELPGVPTNQALVLEVQAGWGGGFLFATLYTFGIFLRADDCASGSLSLAAPAIYQINYDGYANPTEVNADPDRGLLIGQLRDCDDVKVIDSTGGLSMPHELLYYLSSTQPDPDAVATDSSGFFIAANTTPIRGLVAALVRRQGTPVSLWARPARVFPGAASLVLFDRPRAPR